MKRIIGPVALGLLALAGCSRAPDVASVQALDPWCRPSAAGAFTAACYVTLTANTDDRLLGATTPLAKSIDIHATQIDERGVASMTMHDHGLPLPKGRACAFTAGGDHLMLMAPTKALAGGDVVPLTLTFQKAPPLTLSARVEAPVG